MAKQKNYKNNNKIQPTLKENAELEKSYNEFENYVMNYVEGFVSKLFNDGQIKVVDEATLQKYFANPDQYYNELSNLMTYYYISDGDIYQLYNLIQILPTLNYKINVFDNSKKYEKNLPLCNKALHKVKYKQLTRDLLSQECARGTVVCTWLGDKKNPYLFIFDELKYVFPKYRRNGEWVCVIDMDWFKQMKEEERTSYFENLSPIVTENDYNAYLSNSQDSTKRYIELPQETTTCLRINTLFRNQRIGLPNGTQALYDKLHKQTLRNLEKAISEKIIKNIAIVKIGSDKNTDYANQKLNPNVKKKIVQRVKQALAENIKDGIPVLAVPEYVDIAFGKMENLDGLKKDKFEGVNSDISSDLGVSTALTNGTGANFASAKLNLEILYKRIGVMLEGIEDVFNKLFTIILPSSVADNYVVEFDKTVPLSTKEQVDILMKLHSEGFAVKPILDNLSGIDYNIFISQSIYEIETLKLREKIIPPMTSYTTSGKDNGNGAPTVDNPDNPNTIKSKATDANNLPE